MPDNITITIDGMEITTQPGKMVLEAAIDAGVYIPYLCYHSGMKPYAACRMCVVSVEGGRGFPASCTLPVQDGMNVRSESHDVTELRRSVMQMLIAEHPSGCLTCHRIDICGPTNICLRHVSVNDRCVTCPKNERCEFKDTVRYLGMELESPLNYTYKQIPLEVKDPFYDRDMNLCITCGRCVRVCEEVRGDDAIAFVERSGKALVGTSFGSSLLESGCEFCGACVDVCPVGALVEKENKWEKARQVVPTICPHCPVGCQLNLELNSDGKMIRVLPEINSPANRGQACFKGKFGLGFINNPQRLSTPLIRRDGQLEPTTWEEALAYVAQRLAEYKGDSFALLTSPSSTNEEHYLAQKFARTVMGTNNVDQSSNTQPELTIGLERALGYGAATNPIWQLEQANCILVFNSNLTEEQNVVGVPIKRSVKNGTKLIVIDAREVELTRYADTWLRPVPGTELLLLGGILKSLLDQSLESSEWLEEWCEEPATLHYVLRSVEIAQIARVTQVSAEAIAQAASYFGGADNSAIVYALDNVPGEVQRDCVNALVDMVLLTGNIGRPGTGIYPMRQGTNEQGAWDVGCVPFRLPGGKPWRDENARQEVETLWGCSLPESRGMGVAAIMEAALSKTVKALILIGDGAHLIDRSFENGLATLDNLDFLVVMDSFLSPAAQLADVVLPRATFAEKDGTYTNLERRVQRIRPAIKNDEGKSQPEGWVICQIAQLMGSAGFIYASSAAVMDELSQITPLYLGITFDRLDQQMVTVFKSDLESPKPTQLLYATKEQRGIQWPFRSETNGGTAILYADGFPMGKANPITPEFRKAEVPINSDYPFQYVPGRVLLQRDRETSVVGEKHNRIVREEWVQLNPADAKGLSVNDGDTIEVQTEHGRLRGEARFDKSIPTGMVSVTSLFGQLAVSLQESEEPDAMANVPGLNIAPAKVTRVDS